MPIDSPVLKAFSNESARVMADKATGSLSFVDAFLDAARGRGVATLLGTTDVKLFRDQPWEESDFADISDDLLVGAGETDGRGPMTLRDLARIVRFAQFIRTAKTFDSTIQAFLAGKAVNPRA